MIWSMIVIQVGNGSFQKLETSFHVQLDKWDYWFISTYRMSRECMISGWLMKRVMKYYHLRGNNTIILITMVGVIGKLSKYVCRNTSIVQVYWIYHLLATFYYHLYVFIQLFVKNTTFIYCAINVSEKMRGST